MAIDAREQRIHWNNPPKQIPANQSDSENGRGAFRPIQDCFIDDFYTERSRVLHSHDTKCLSQAQLLLLPFRSSTLLIPAIFDFLRNLSPHI